MGVSGLLPLLKSIQRNTSLKAYAGQTLGVDAFGWLHRGAVACSLQLALDKPTTQYVQFVLNKVRMLLDFGITPYLVFDGAALPSKAGTNAKRKAERTAAKELGLSLYRSGKSNEAKLELQKAVSITPQMTYTVIKALRKLNVQILVAPYEADAQLVYLEQQGIIDGVLSEDSDLLVFGVKKLITKLDQYGACIEIDRADLCRNKDISFAGWSDAMFRRMAILSGCDYLDNVTKIGLKTAHELVKKHKEAPKIVRAMAFNGKYVVPESYLTDFNDAERAFLYHRVFCPKAGKLMFLNEIPPDIKEDQMPFLGPNIEPEIAVAVACGDLDPKTQKPWVQSASLGPGTIKENYHRMTAGSNELKAKRSIDNFFQPTRQPLAELDPNSLTPSPSQHRILQRNRNASWEPQPIVHSAPQLRRSITDVPVVPYSDLERSSSAFQTDRSAYLSRAGALSSYKPVKRIRLCSESDEISPSKEVKQSRFFAPVSIDQSPLASRKVRDRAKKSHFDVFSDDSIEGAMLELGQQVTQIHEVEVSYPNLPPLANQDTQTEEFVDIVPQSSPAKAQDKEFNSQSSHGTVELNGLSVNTAEAVENTEASLENDPETFVDLLEFHVNKLNKETRVRKLSTSRTFADLSPKQQAAALASLNKSADTQAASAEKEARDEEDGDLEAEEITSSQRRNRQTFRNLAKTFALQTSALQNRALRSLGALQVPRVQSNIGVSLFTFSKNARGSEDSLAIVRSSDNEEETSDVDVGQQQQASKVLDIKSFQYAA